MKVPLPLYWTVKIKNFDMDISRAQAMVDEWIKEHGVRYFDEKTNTLILMEEVGELSRLMARQYGEQSFKKNVGTEEVKRKIRDEISDVFFVLLCLCNQMDIDLKEGLIENMKKKSGRDKDRHKANPKLK